MKRYLNYATSRLHQLDEEIENVVNALDTAELSFKWNWRSPRLKFNIKKLKDIIETKYKLYDEMILKLEKEFVIVSAKDYKKKLEAGEIDVNGNVQR